jgi:hypothetical protein
LTYINYIKVVFLGLAQALAVLFVCAIAISALSQLQKWESSTDGYLDSVALVLIFVVSALVSATLVLAYPAYLLLSQRLKEGFSLLFSTILWLIIILVCMIGVIIFI